MKEKTRNDKETTYEVPPTLTEDDEPNKGVCTWCDGTGFIDGQTCFFCFSPDNYFSFLGPQS